MRVEMVLDDGRERARLVVTGPPGTTWGQVRERLQGLDGPETVWRAAGRALTDDLLVGGPPLLRGAVLRSGPRPADEAWGPRRSALALHVVGGPAAGRVVPLPPGRHLLGRGAGCGVRLEDPALSRTHAALLVDDQGVVVEDAGSTNGCRVDGLPVCGPTAVPVGSTLRLGASSLRLVRCGSPTRVVPRGDGTLSASPAPRRRTALPREVLPRPAEPPAPETRPFPWALLVLPLLVSGVVAALLRAPSLAALGVLGPVMALASHLTERRAARRRHAAATRRHAERLAAHDQQVDVLLRRTAGALEERTLDLASALDAAARRGGRWWSPRDDPGALTVRLGRDAVPTDVSVRDADGALHRQGLPDAPVEVDLRRAGVLAVAGPGGARVATGLVGALAAGHPPSDLRVHVLSSRPRDRTGWSWTGWLPHSPAPAPEPGELGAYVDRLLASRVGAPDPAPLDETAAPVDLVVLPSPRDRAAPWATRLVEAARPGGDLVILAVAEDPHDLHPGARSWMRLRQDGRADVVLPGDERRVGVRPDLAAPGWADALAAHLAPLAPPEGTAGRPPERVALSQVLGPVLGDPDEVRRRWRRPDRRPLALLGHDGDCVVGLDLERDGPHVLLGGTTGSGKSELLQTLALTLACALPPTEMTFLLVDYKGGAAFDRCADLPHTVGLVTDLDDQLAERALVSLHAELARRERLLREAGRPDLASLLAHPGPVPPPPRLVILVDELRALAQELPGFVQGLLRVATTGRSLGVHLVLATQRPAGVVTPDIRANVDARLCLRVRDRADSTDVLGSPAAAHLDDRLPGRALWAAPDGSVRELQAAWAGAPVQEPTALEVEVVGGRRRDRPCRAAPDAAAPGVRAGSPAPRTRPDTELDVLVPTLVRACADQPRPPRPWLPVLPPAVPLPPPTSRDEGWPLGLVDEPTEQRQPAYVLPPGRHLAVVGAQRTGRTTALRSLALVACRAEATAPASTHLHVVDGGGALADLASLPQHGTRATRDDPRLVLRLLELLGADLRAGHLPTRTLLLVDRWDAVTGATDPLTAAALQDALVTLLRDGPGAGLSVAVAGDRSVLTSALAPHLGERLLLRLPDPTDLALCGLSPRQAPQDQPPGRALRGADGAEVQVALTTAADTARTARTAPRPLEPPRRLVPLPAQVRADALPPGAFAVGGDDASPVPSPLPTHPVVVVLGPPGSGRSSALVALARTLPGSLTRSGEPRCVVVSPRPSPLDAWAREQDGVQRTHDPEQVRRLAVHEDVLLVLDDVDALHDDALELACAQAAERAGTGGPRVLLAGSTEALATSYRPLAALARRAGVGVVLQPRSPADGDLLGARLPRLHQPPPGRGHLVVRGRVQPVQLALPTQGQGTMHG